MTGADDDRSLGGFPVEPSQVTVVVPTYNEIETLEAAVSGVTRHGYRLLIVDDGSPDGTGELADRLAANDRLVEVLHRSGKQGLGTAYMDGFTVALSDGARIVCEMDADLSHDPDRLPALVDPVIAQVDVAIGSRFVPGGEIVDWPARRRLLSRWGNRYARLALGVPLRDLTSGFRAFRSTALEAIEFESCRSDGYAFQVEMAWRAHRAGLRILEVPITFTERRLGESKLDGRIVREAMWLVTRWGLRRVLRRS